MPVLRRRRRLRPADPPRRPDAHRCRIGDAGPRAPLRSAETPPNRLRAASRPAHRSLNRIRDATPPATRLFSFRLRGKFHVQSISTRPCRRIRRSRRGVMVHARLPPRRLRQSCFPSHARHRRSRRQRRVCADADLSATEFRRAGVRCRVQLVKDHFPARRNSDFGRSDLAASGGNGWEPLDTELQWGNFCWPEHELMATVGFDVSWAGTGTGTQVQPFNLYTPVIDVGKGFGDLPTSLNWLRPAAVTFELSETFPGQASTDGNQNATNLNWGFSLQYSLPYYNANVAEIDNPFWKHIIPLTEFTFSKPVYNFAPGTNVTTGTIQPGAVYLADTWQLAVEAIIPINGASGHGVGVVASVDLFLDDLLPDSLGKQ